MTKIAYNNCHGGFYLSDRAILRYAELKGWTVYPKIIGPQVEISYWIVPPGDPDRLRAIEIHTRFHSAPADELHWAIAFCKTNRLSRKDYDRDDPTLIQVIEELGPDASGTRFSELAIEEIPDGTEWGIGEYDGLETVLTGDDLNEPHHPEDE